MLGIEEQIRNSSCYGVAYDGTLPECKRCDVSQRCSARCAALSEKEDGELTIEVPFTQISSPPTVVQVEKSKTSKTTQPAKPVSSTLSSLTKKPKIKTPKTYDPSMPVLKNLSIAELKELAIQRKCEGLEGIESITSQQIQRMRYIMLIKATYEIK